MQKSTSSSAGRPAKASRSPGSGRGSRTPEEDLCLTLLTSLNVTNLDGCFGKTSPEFSQATEEGILAPSSGRWQTWGISTDTGCWTLSGSEHNSFPVPSPNEDVVCSLSDILEVTTVPQRYYLTARACAGILRRAAARQKTLPPMLQQALSAVAGNLEAGQGETAEESDQQSQTPAED